MQRFVFLLILICSNAFANRVILIGDSHTAGLFGKTLHQKLTTKFEQVVTLGHASSAAYHWIDEKEFYLSGGVFNELFVNKINYSNPHPTHWREKVLVPKFQTLLKDNAYHKEWKNHLNHPIQSDLIVIALGANDARAIADQNGNYDQNQLNLRGNAINKMLSLINEQKMKCLWIGPPNGSKKTEANQNALYQYLAKRVKPHCQFMDSRHYVAKNCDGVHFNCPSEYPLAKKWANEAFQFILKNL